MPRFAFEYLDSATGTEAGARRNRAALDAVGFMPAILRGDLKPDLAVRFLAQEYTLPLVIAPVGMAGAIWPGAEATLAAAAARLGIAWCQSTVAAATPEDTGALSGPYGWFQHYPVRDPDIRADMLRRILAAGYETLVVTVDVPAESRRERQRRAYLAMPPKPTLRMATEMALAPAWTLAMARTGAPRMQFAMDYAKGKGKDAFEHAGRIIRGYPDREDLKRLRGMWRGPMIVKGVLDPGDAAWLKAEGVDGIWVSNHTGRQFEAGPAAIAQLPLVREAVGPDLPLIYDSGIEGGLDILRAMALGADMVALGKGFMFALAAFGADGIDHLIHILGADMTANMAQIGAASYADLPGRRIDVDPA
ncbi:alpha-hydroxy-acid oxidizing protein [Rhodobacterales bacterium HKCCE2091]|nr:alpha-hydroxy-acid oxidizing protein [Rhodobacterales bacterium HKCCE2091]